MRIRADGAETLAYLTEELATISVAEVNRRLWVQYTSNTELCRLYTTTHTCGDAEASTVIVNAGRLWANKHSFERFDPATDGKVIIITIVELTTCPS